MIYHTVYLFYCSIIFFRFMILESPILQVLGFECALRHMLRTLLGSFCFKFGLLLTFLGDFGLKLPKIAYNSLLIFIKPQVRFFGNKKLHEKCRSKSKFEATFARKGDWDH